MALVLYIFMLPRIVAAGLTDTTETNASSVAPVDAQQPLEKWRVSNIFRLISANLSKIPYKKTRKRNVVWEIKLSYIDNHVAWGVHVSTVISIDRRKRRMWEWKE